MKCSNCLIDLITSLRCPYCPYLFCSLSCLESHYSLNHNLNLFHKNESKNNLYFQHATKINSIFLVKGVLNTKINYNEIFNINNFIPVYQPDGRLKIIGSGSYGKVYLGQNIIDKKYYAIKHMNKKNIFLILNSLLNIQKEIDIQSRIDHPNIVKLLYVKETESSYDLIMEYAKEGNLFHYIRTNKGLSENQSFSIFIQVVNAITFLHENDLIHRDIKPENILLFENNIVKLCDFGWCVKLNGYQRGTFCGTTEYMSPELVNHQVYGKEIDTWSLGILLYEMIHGYSPFKPNKTEFEAEDVMENIVNHNLKFKKQLSDRCKKLIYGLLDSNINNRYTVEDIFNSDFVRYYENIEKNKINYNNYNYDFIGEKQPKTQINNILYSPQIEMNNNINIHMSMDYNNYIYNIQIPGRNNSYDFVKKNHNNEKINIQNINKGIYGNYIRNAEISKNNSFNSSLKENYNYNSESNVNDNLYKSAVNNLINFNNIIPGETQTENKKKKLSINKTNDNYFIKKKEEEIKDLYSYSNDYTNINKYNSFEITINKEDKEKHNINSNNNYFFEAKNYIKNKSHKKKNNKNIDDVHIIEISNILNNKNNNDKTKKQNGESFDKNSNKNFYENYLLNNICKLNNDKKKDNHSKTKLVKRPYLKNGLNDLNTKLPLISLKTPQKYLSNINSQNTDSVIYNNKSVLKSISKNCFEIENQNHQSNIKTPEKNRFISDSFKDNNKFISKSVVLDSNIKEKEPKDNIQRKSPSHKNEIRIKEINKSQKLNNNTNQLIKSLQNNKRKNENSKSNINILKNSNFDKIKEALSRKNKNINNTKTEKDIIVKMKNNKTYNNISPNTKHLTSRRNDKNPKDGKKITKFIYKPKNDIESKSKIYYKTEIKDNINNTSESSNLYLPTNSNDLYDAIETNISEINIPKKQNRFYPLYINEKKVNINKYIFKNNIPKIRKKNIIKNIEEKRPTNNKKNHSIEKQQNPQSLNKISYDNKKFIRPGNNYLVNNYSYNNIMKISNNNKSSKTKENNIQSKDNSINITNVKKTNYLDIRYKEKEKLNIIKNGIKKIYIYNNQIKNIHEKEKSKNLNINKGKKIEKTNIDDRSYDNRNKNKGIINYKNSIFPIKDKESNITNNFSNKNDINDERNKTPEKESIFNPVKPNILIESFKKELENKTNMIKIKYNIVKK